MFWALSIVVLDSKTRSVVIGVNAQAQPSDYGLFGARLSTLCESTLAKVPTSWPPFSAAGRRMGVVRCFLSSCNVEVKIDDIIEQNRQQDLARRAG